MDLASRVRFSGPLKPYAAGFEAELARLGYTPEQIRELRAAAVI